MTIFSIFFRLIKVLLLTALLLLGGFIIIFLLPAVWHRFITYPHLEKQRLEFVKLRREPQRITELNTYRGIMHSHSYWSHDSDGTLHDLVPAAKKNLIDFIFLTDHPHGDTDSFPRGYNGYYEGVLIHPGSEKEGLTVWPMDSCIISWDRGVDTVMRNMHENGDIVFLAHTEESHNWSNPYYHGFEIYNFHADVKDEYLTPLLVNLLVNRKRYGNWALRQAFDEQSEILSLWDSLNTTRKVVGSSAADVHENQNIRARYLPDGRVEWVGPNADIIDTSGVNILNRWLFSEPDGNGWIFRIMLDTYETGFNHVVNYVMADTLSVSSLAEHIRNGHLFTAFSFLADACGFTYFAVSYDDSIHLSGDSVSLEEIKSFRAVSPYPAQFRLIHNGKVVRITIEDNYSFSSDDMFERGAWRLELHIKQGKKYIPWVYTNPVYIY